MSNTSRPVASSSYSVLQEMLDEYLSSTHEPEAATASAQALQRIQEQMRIVRSEQMQPPVQWVNGCDQTVPQALRYLANHNRPAGGQELFNAEHLFQLADEIERMASKPLYAAAGVVQADSAAAKVASLQRTVKTLRAKLSAAVDELARSRNDANWPFSEGWEVLRFSADPSCTDEFNRDNAWGVRRTTPPYCDKSGQRQWVGPTLAQAMREACEALGLPLEPCANVQVQALLQEHAASLNEVLLRSLLDTANDADSARWELGMRAIVQELYGPDASFDIPEVVQDVRNLVQRASPSYAQQHAGERQPSAQLLSEVRDVLKSFTRSSYIRHQHPKRTAQAMAVLKLLDDASSSTV